MFSSLLDLEDISNVEESDSMAVKKDSDPYFLFKTDLVLIYLSPEVFSLSN